MREQRGEGGDDGRSQKISGGLTLNVMKYMCVCVCGGCN